MYALVTCECGTSVESFNLQKHIESLTHEKRLAKIQAYFREGAKDPLIRCSCGIIHVVSKGREHKEGSNHTLQSSYRIKGIEPCVACGLRFKNGREAHLKSDLHRSNMVAAEALIKQETRKRRNHYPAYRNKVEEHVVSMRALVAQVNQLTLNEAQDEIVDLKEFFYFYCRQRERIEENVVQREKDDEETEINEIVAIRNGRSRSLSGESSESNEIREVEPIHEEEAYHNCPICHAPQENEETITTICNHQFHRACLQTWTTTNQTCPMCRTLLEY